MSNDIKQAELICPKCSGREVSLGKDSVKAPTLLQMILPKKLAKRIPNNMPVYKSLHIVCDSCGYAWMYDIPKEKIQLSNLKANVPLPKEEDVSAHKVGDKNLYIIHKMPGSKKSGK